MVGAMTSFGPWKTRPPQQTILRGGRQWNTYSLATTCPFPTPLVHSFLILTKTGFNIGTGTFLTTDSSYTGKLVKTSGVDTSELRAHCAPITLNTLNWKTFQMTLPIVLLLQVTHRAGFSYTPPHYLIPLTNLQLPSGTLIQSPIDALQKRGVYKN